ncbi:MAG: 16S rRNA methyltransferase [Thermoproteota archaeon]|jgi:rRNA small subunit pseudouridine methyltransferase Nep1
MKFKFLIAESSLELIPKEIINHPAVISDAYKRGKDPSKIILDRAKHHFAMLKLPNSTKRGRPDIIHSLLLVHQYSLLAQNNLSKIYIHTLEDKIIEVNNKTRIPKNYNNFIGLIEQLYEKGAIISDGEELLKLIDMKLKEFIQGNSWVVFHEKGDKISLNNLANLLEGKIIIIGGFPHEDFENEWILKEAEKVIRIGDKVLDSFQILFRIITILEMNLNLI